MTLEAVMSQQDLLGCCSKEMYNLLEDNWDYEFNSMGKESYNILEEESENFLLQNHDHLLAGKMIQEISESEFTVQQDVQQPETTMFAEATRPKRRRSRMRKNVEEIESQRMTHIAVERNRRKQMNEYLSILRSLMPDSYAQKGDQASIVGGAIDYVKELEQQLHLLGGQKHFNENQQAGCSSSLSTSPSSSSSTKISSFPFDEFFTFPQYSTYLGDLVATDGSQSTIATRAAADIQVTMVESHANVKIRSKRWPKQVLKLVSGLQSLRLTVLHLNFTTVDEFVLYSLSLKVEGDCRMDSVDEIAGAVNELLARINEDHNFY